MEGAMEAGVESSHLALQDFLERAPYAPRL